MTPREQQDDISTININILPSWSEQQLQEAFILIRDFKHLKCSNIVNNRRAIPWLYVENGCFLRAALAKNLLYKKGFPKVGKIFAFGSFRFKSKWSPNGIVTFTDHVALIVNCGGEGYVLDPSVHYNHPITLEKWSELLTSESNDKTIQYSLCSDLTFGHNSHCNESNVLNEVGIRRGMPHTIDFFTMEFLAKEFENITALKQDPMKVLSVEQSGD